MSKKKTTEDFKKDVKEKVGDEYTVLGEYKDCKTKIKMRHNTCGHEYEVMPNSFLNGRRCGKCSGRIKKTTEEFKQEVKEKVGEEYTVLGEYIENHTKIKMRHNTCGHEYEVTPSNFLKGTKCPKCSKISADKKQTKTTEEFKQEVKEKVGDEYTVLGEYINSKTKIKMRHNICGHEYEVTPSNFLKGTECPKCARLKIINKITKTTEEFKQEVKEKVGDEYTMIGKYINYHTKIKMRHNTCGNEYEVMPNVFLSGCRCPKCADSKGNKYIYNYLKNNNISFIDEKSFDTCKYKNVLSFDFYIPHMNLLIEFDGKGHFEPSFGKNSKDKDFNLQLKRDQIKNKWVENNNIKLIRIGYKDYDKLEEILNEILLTNDFDPNNYDSIYMYSPKSKMLYESGMYKEIPEINENILNK